MDKIETFFIELEEELRFLKPKDANEVIKYYRNRISIALDYGENPGHILATIPTPSKIAEEIYNSKGVNYLNIRKKQMRKNQIVKAIFSSILLLMIVVSLITIYTFLVISIVKLSKLMVLSFKMDSIVDTISITLLVVSYIVIILGLMIYIFDLFYIIGSHFLLNVLDAITKEEKEYKFIDFTISGSFEKLFKKKRMFVKILLGFVLCFILLGVVNYVTEGYIYRSMNNIAFTDQTLEIMDDVNSITVKDSQAFIKIKASNDNHIKINYGFEFKNELGYKVENNNLIIDSITTTKYDVFGLLDEPLPLIEINIPLKMNVDSFDITLTSGILDIVDMKSKINLKISGNNSTVAITRSTLNNFEVIDGFNLNINLEDNIINDAKIKLTNGRYASVGDTYSNILVENHLADFILQKVKVVKADISCRAARTAFDKVVFDILTYTDANSESHLRDVHINEANLSSNGSSKITLERVVAKNEINLVTKGGTIAVTYLKANNIKITQEQGTITLQNVNRNDATKDQEENTYKTTYNNYSIIDSSITINSTKATMNIENSTFENLTSNLQEGRLDITSSKVNISTHKEKDASLNFTDIEGTSIDIYVNGGSLYFYNDGISSSIDLTLDGELIKTSISIGNKNIKKKEQ